MKPILLWSLYQRRWSVLFWSLGVAVFIFINMIFYPSFKDQAAELQKSFEHLSDTTLQFIGGSTDFFSPVGFLNSQIYFLLLPLILLVLAISLGSSLLAREEQDHTIDSMLARPISRSRLLIAKGSTGLLILSSVAVVGFIVTAITAKAVDLRVPIINMLAASLVCWMMVLSIGAVAYAVTAFGRARVASLAIAAGYGFGGYIISSLAGTVSWLGVPSKLFAFHYYQSEALLRGTYNWVNIVFFLGLFALCCFLAWLGFRSRDLA